MTVFKRKFFFTTLLASIFVLTSCSNDGTNDENARGTLHIELGVDNKIDGVTNTRAGEEESPSVNDFALTIYKGTEEWRTFDRFSLVPEEISMPIGKFTVKATYGQIYNEGFNAPYFVGSEDVEIKDDDDKSVSVTCTLGNAKVRINYTDAFKMYFKDYSTEVNSQGNSPITFAKNETRAAYFKPGSVDININVTKAQGSTAAAKIFGKTITTAARHEYDVTLDVDAGSNQLMINFNDSVSEESRTVDVSDEALNFNPPTMKAYGFTSGSTIELYEGQKANASEVKAYINASGGIYKCILSTSSEALLDKGWPAEVDLAALTDTEKTTLNSLGLKTIGLGANKENIAIVDFTNVIPMIPFSNVNAKSTFRLSVVDKYSRVSEDTLTLNVTTKDNQFTSSIDTTGVKIGSTKVDIPITLNYNPDGAIQAYYQSYGVYKSATYTVAANETSNSYTISVNMASINSDQKIRLTCGSKSYDVKVGLKAPSYEVKALKTSDVWSNKATLTIVGEDEAATNYIKGKSVTVQLQKDGTTNWFTPSQTQNGSTIELTDIAVDDTEAVKYNVKSSFNMYDSPITATTSTFTTEAKKQLPNASFEYWYSVERRNGKWYEYYPWSDSDDNTKGWDTMNKYTFQLEDKYGYNSNSGTISTTDSNSGNAALIRTMGWGPYGTSGNVTNASSSKPCMNKTPGELYLGSFNSSTMAPDYGMSFTSRPKSLSFYYKYTPHDTDQFVIEIVVENRNNGTVTELGKGSFSEGGTTSSYKYKTVDVTYTNTKLNATHLRVLFKSGTESWSNEKHTGESYWLEVPETFNLSDGKYVASMLYIDDVTLNY